MKRGRFTLHNNHTYKHTGIPWLGDVPAHWGVRRIKDVSTCNDETLSENTDSDFSFQYIDISTVSEGKIGKPQQFTFGKAPSRARRITRPNDILVSTVRTYLKAIAKVDDVNGLIASTGFAVLRAKTIDPSFFSYALMNDMFAQTVAANSVGVSYPAINASDLVNLSIPLPPLAEQRAIAAFLDQKTAQLDGAIESVEKSVELLRELRAATISEAVTRGLNAHAPLRDSGVPWIGKVPEHWQVRRIKHVANVYSGATPKSNVASFWDGSVNWITPADYCSECKYVSKGNRSITEEGLNSCGTKLVPKGSVIVSNRAPIGTVSIAANDLCTSQGCKSLVPHEFSPDYLYYYLLTANQELISLGTGTTFFELSTNNLKNQKIVCPPLEEQQEIACYLDEKTAQIDALVSAKQHQVQLLRELRASVIAEAVTGKLPLTSS